MKTLILLTMLVLTACDNVNREQIEQATISCEGHGGLSAILDYSSERYSSHVEYYVQSKCADGLIRADTWKGPLYEKD
jgi:hypothetical protein